MTTLLDKSVFENASLAPAELLRLIQSKAQITSRGVVVMRIFPPETEDTVRCIEYKNPYKHYLPSLHIFTDRKKLTDFILNSGNLITEREKELNPGMFRVSGDTIYVPTTVYTYRDNIISGSEWKEIQFIFVNAQVASRIYDQIMERVILDHQEKLDFPVRDSTGETSFDQ